ncbi:hypothetical protein EON65_49040 [archaeon]|nr:MAG: hypothetical protein EON65_49040 [archaeon]
MFSLDALERAAIEKELSAGIKHAPGNTYCSCLATKHTFVTNCTACGYIVCSKVILASQKVASVLPLHPFPSSANATNAKTNIVHAKIPSPSAKNSNICPFCGSVFFMSSDHPDNHKTAAKTAYEQRDRLLNFDREHAKRTQVRDSQADYYVTNAWSSQEEREQADEDDKKRMNR